MRRLTILLALACIALPLVTATTHEACQAVFGNEPQFTSYKQSSPDGGGVYNQTSVDILANFTKSIPADNVNAILRRGGNNEDIAINGDPTTGESTNYEYKPDDARIPDGTYYLSVSGNDGFVTTRSCVTFNVSTPQMNIWVTDPSPTQIEQPTFAYSTDRTFNVTLASEREALCRMAYTANVNDLSDLPNAYDQMGVGNQLTDTTSTTHEKTVTVNTVNDRKAYDVICQEPSEQGDNEYSYQRIQTGYQPQQSSVNLTARPARLIDYTDRYTNITTASSDDVLCTINDTENLLTNIDPQPWTDPDPVDYTTQQTYNAEAPESGSTTIRAVCTNKAGLTTNVTTSFEAAYDEEETIQIEQLPSPTNADQIPLTVSTAGSDRTCTATVDNNEYELTPQGLQISRYHHTTNISVTDEGTYDVNITCLQGNIPTTTATSLIYDTTPPEPPQIQAEEYACSPTTASFTLAHNETTTLSYTVRDNDNKSTTYDSAQLTTDEWDVDADLPDLPINTTIRVDATASDEAGNNQTRSQQLIVKNPDATVCDYTSPTISLDKNASNTSDEVIYDVTCSDNRACQDTYQYSMSTNPGTCTYDQQNNQNDSIRITQNGYLCVAVYDENDNNATTTRAIKQATPPHCSDGTQNVDETGVDCGGPQSSCALCGQGQGCETNSDCYPTLTCQDGTCQQPLEHCSNDIKDPSETGVDCGGPDCAPCNNESDPGENNTDVCQENSDCASNICIDGSCAAPTCSDGVKNQFETAVDCGGPNCAACEAEPGKPCETDEQCPGPRFSCEVIEGVSQCTQTPPHCSNNETDASETGVDCGGPDCSACELDQSCQSNNDCLSGLCTDGSCAAPTCSDGVQNQGETDVDCGGPNCDACQIGDQCTTDNDCTSLNCNGETNLCVEASCTNNKQDGDETDVDCGGSTCVQQGYTCANDQSCERDADCASNYCADDGTCRIPPEKDSDNDGLPDRWENEHGASVTSLEPFQDPDGDGYTNLEEYQAGTDPNDESSYPEPPENNTPAYILLITGLLFGGAGATLIYYDQDNKSSSSQTPTPTPKQPRQSTSYDQQTSTQQQEDQTTEDDSTMQELEQERDELLSSFEDDTHQDDMNFTTSAPADHEHNTASPEETSTEQKTDVEPPSHPGDFVSLDDVDDEADDEEEDVFDQLGDKT